MAEPNGDIREQGAFPNEIDTREHAPSHECVEAYLKAEMEALHAAAQHQVDRYWKRHYQVKSQTTDRSKWGTYGVRARIYKEALNIEWYRLKKAGVQTKKGKAVMLAEHVPMGRGRQCPLSRFTRATDWEREMVERIEPVFAKLRNQSAELGKIRGQVRRYIAKKGNHQPTEQDGRD